MTALRRYRAQCRSIQLRLSLFAVMAFLGMGVFVSADILERRPWRPWWIGGSCIGAAAVGIWWQSRRLSHIIVHAVSRGISPRTLLAEQAPRRHPGHEEDATRAALLEAALDCTCLGPRGDLPQIEPGPRNRLVMLYGDTWLQANEEPIRAMLTFVSEFRIVASRSGWQFSGRARMEPAGACLLRIVGCMRHAGVFDQPAIMLGPTPSAFVDSFAPAAREEGIRSTVTSPRTTADYAWASTDFILTLAISMAVDAAAGEAKAA